MDPLVRLAGTALPVVVIRARNARCAEQQYHESEALRVHDVSLLIMHKYLSSSLSKAFVFPSICTVNHIAICAMNFALAPPRAIKADSARASLCGARRTAILGLIL